jgi:hypothetical protein
MTIDDIKKHNETFQAMVDELTKQKKSLDIDRVLKSQLSLIENYLKTNNVFTMIILFHLGLMDVLILTYWIFHK